MTVDRGSLIGRLRAAQPDPWAGVVTPPDFSVPDLVREWLRDGVDPRATRDRDEINALCRQVDVRKRVSVSYGPGWSAVSPEVPAPGAVVLGLVAVLLATAARPSGIDDGWNLKLVNSALKALDLDLVPAATEVPALRAWALELLDRAAAEETV